MGDEADYQRDFEESERIALAERVTLENIADRAMDSKFEGMCLANYCSGMLHWRQLLRDPNVPEDQKAKIREVSAMPPDIDFLFFEMERAFPEWSADVLQRRKETMRKLVQELRAL